MVHATQRTPVDLERARLLGHRAAVQGLGGGHRSAELGVLTVGLQDTPAGSAPHGLRVRATPADAGTVDRLDLVLALTVRGSPHLHRRADLPLLRAALTPRSNEELRAYLGGYGDILIDSGVDGPALLDQVASTMREVFPGPTATKGALSGAVSQHLPEIARPWCEGCGVAHVAEGLFRLGTLLAGIELVPTDGRRQLYHVAGGQPEATGDRTALLRAFVRMAGPVGLDDVAAMRSAPPAPDLLLLPPRDAYLLGSWRARRSGRTLKLTVTRYAPLSAAQRASAGARAELVAELRGAAGATVEWVDGSLEQR